MGKHRKLDAQDKRMATFVTTGLALEVAAVFAFTHATQGQVTVDTVLTASTSIFVDGTKSLTGSDANDPADRMRGAFDGAYDQTKSPRAGKNVIVDYSRSIGPLTGLGDPTYDQSEAEATAEIVTAVKEAKKPENGYQTGQQIYVVGYSQGSGAASQAITKLEAEGYDTKDVTFVLAADPRRNDGGILARLPKGVYVPILGVSFGDGTTPEKTKVIQVTKQYDGVADAPNYVFNVVADANAILGYVYLHPGYYKTVDPSTDPNRTDRIVTTSADGNITDVLIKAPVGQLPLTMPLLQLGVPASVVTALDPFLRAVIETGYDRPAVAPSTPVPFQLVPPPAKWLPDAVSVANGAAQTAQALAGTAAPAAVPNGSNNRSALAAPSPEVTAPVQQTITESDDKTPKPDPVVKPSTSPTTPKPQPPNFFRPPQAPPGGWKPGDILRSILSGPPKSTTGSTPSNQPSAGPVTPSTPDDTSPSKPSGDTGSPPS